MVLYSPAAFVGNSGLTHPLVDQLSAFSFRTSATLAPKRGSTVRYCISEDRRSRTEVWIAQRAPYEYSTVPGNCELRCTSTVLVQLRLVRVPYHHDTNTIVASCEYSRLQVHVSSTPSSPSRQSCRKTNSGGSHTAQVFVEHSYSGGQRVLAAARLLYSYEY